MSECRVPEVESIKLLRMSRCGWRDYIVIAESMDELIEASICNLMGVAPGSNYYLDLLIGMSALYCQPDFILGEDYTF